MTGWTPPKIDFPQLPEVWPLDHFKAIAMFLGIGTLDGDREAVNFPDEFEPV